MALYESGSHRAAAQIGQAVVEVVRSPLNIHHESLHRTLLNAYFGSIYQSSHNLHFISHKRDGWHPWIAFSFAEEE